MQLADQRSAWTRSRHRTDECRLNDAQVWLVVSTRPRDGEIEDVQHHAFDFEQGGFRDRLTEIFGRVLGPTFGRGAGLRGLTVLIHFE